MVHNNILTLSWTDAGEKPMAQQSTSQDLKCQDANSKRSKAILHFSPPVVHFPYFES